MQRYLVATTALLAILATTTSAAPTADDMKATLRYLNERKCMHGQDTTKFYTECADASAFAQSWSDTMASTGTFAHSGKSYDQKVCSTTGLGENISYASSKSATLLDAAKMFYADEVGNYDFTKNDGSCTSGQCGHFSSVIWSDATVLGAGLAVGKATYCTITPGTLSGNGVAPNMSGYYKKNVSPVAKTEAECVTIVANWYAGSDVTPTPDEPDVTPTPDEPDVIPTPDEPDVTPTPDEPDVTPTPEPDVPDVTPTPDVPDVTPTPDVPDDTPSTDDTDGGNSSFTTAISSTVAVVCGVLAFFA